MYFTEKQLLNMSLLQESEFEYIQVNVSNKQNGRKVNLDPCV